MRTTTWTGLGTGAALVISLLGGMAAAQDADTQAKVEDVQQRFEEAIAAGDWAGLGSLFTETTTVMPISGGLIEDRAGVQSYYEQSGLATLDATSTKTETIGENLILDAGAFTATLSEEAGGGTMDGEYMVLAEDGENGLLIRSLAAFPVRQAPSAPAQ